MKGGGGGAGMVEVEGEGGGGGAGLMVVVGLPRLECERSAQHRLYYTEDDSMHTLPLA